MGECNFIIVFFSRHSDKGGRKSTLVATRPKMSFKCICLLVNVKDSCIQGKQLNFYFGSLLMMSTLELRNVGDDNKHHRLCCKVVIVMDMITTIGLFLLKKIKFHVFSLTIFPLKNTHTHTHT